MIIKIVERKEASKSSYDRLAGYILNSKQSEYILFTATAEYVMDMHGVGEKVAWYRISNCESDVPAVAIAEVLATQYENQQTKSDKTYHIVVSVPHWETLTREQTNDIEDTISKGLGFDEHQRISAVHQNTDQFHLHIAINTIHPKTFNRIEPYYPYYKVDRLARELEIKHGLHQDNRIGSSKSFANVGDGEAHQNQESFLRWLHDNLGERLNEVLEKSQDWQDIHDALAEYGAAIQPKGAGLAIINKESNIGIKASSLHRKLAFKALHSRFGEFQPSEGQVVSQKRYQPLKNSYLPANSELFAAYRKEKDENKVLREQTLAVLNAEYQAEIGSIKNSFSERRQKIRTNQSITAISKRGQYSALSKLMKTELQERQERFRYRKQVLQKTYPLRSWDEYLVNRAQNGHTEALKILRTRRSIQKQINQTLLTVESLDQAKHILQPHFKPFVTKNGSVLYRADDGGLVNDNAHSISIPQVTAAASMLAISLANDRFPGQSLIVEGTDEFKAMVIKMAALEGISVRFADSRLETARQQYLSSKMPGKAR